MATRFIDDGIMAGTPKDVRLLGGECATCGLVSFPKAHGCARCSGESIGDRELAREGEIWTWTTQGFLPKRPYTGPGTPTDFTPFVLGYVELADGIRIESRLLVDDVSQVHIGQRVELVASPHTVDADGTEVLMFAFRPIDTHGEVAA